MPFFLALTFILFLFLKIKAMGIKEAVGSFVQATSISIFIFQPNIFQNLFGLLDCKSFEPQPGKSFIKNFLSEECFTNRYLIWIISFVLPTFLFYAVFEPITTLVYLYKNRRKLKNTNFLVNMSFLIQGFDKTKFYWYYSHFFN